jgi:hypothetical protein
MVVANLCRRYRDRHIIIHKSRIIGYTGAMITRLPIAAPAAFLRITGVKL